MSNKRRRLSLSAKVNILIVAIVLTVSSLLLAVSNNSYRKTVYDPHVQKLDEYALAEEDFRPSLSNITEFLGTEKRQELREAMEGKDGLTVAQAIVDISSTETDGETRSLFSDLMEVMLLCWPVEEYLELDEIIVEARLNGTMYQVIQDVNHTDREAGYETLNFGRAGSRFPELRPEDFAKAAQAEHDGRPKLIRCIPLQTPGGETFFWIVYDMQELLSNYRAFLVRSILLILGMTALASVTGMLLMRRLVTRRVQRLAKETRSFTPGEDGQFAAASVSAAEAEGTDEIGGLAQDIRAMQERIIDNTENLTRMAAERERLNTELELSTKIQTASLPKTFPDRKEFDLYASMTPAREVGGDFYDFFLVDEDHLGLVIADVSGKGVPAALFMMVAKALIKNQLMTGCDPAQALERVNRQLSEGNTSMMFVTVWLAVVELSTGRGTACNAGHEKPALKRAGGRFELLDYKHDMFAGVMARAKYHNREFELRPGDWLFVYTDGITEAASESKAMFGEDGLKKALNEGADRTPEELIRRVHEAIDGFAGSEPQFDDITMMCMRYNG